MPREREPSRARDASEAELRGELRPALAGILAASELLLKSELDETQEQHVRDIVRSARSLRGACSSRAAPHPAAQTLPLAGRRVLVVQDSRAARRLMRGLLEGWGAQVSTIDSAAPTHAFLDRGRRWDAALIDAALPDDPGSRLASRLLQSPARSERLVVLLAEASPPASFLAWRSRGARALGSPVREPALLQALTGPGPQPA